VDFFWQSFLTKLEISIYNVPLVVVRQRNTRARLGLCPGPEEVGGSGGLLKR